MLIVLMCTSLSAIADRDDWNGGEWGEHHGGWHHGWGGNSYGYGYQNSYVAPCNVPPGYVLVNPYGCIIQPYYQQQPYYYGNSGISIQVPPLQFNFH